MANTNNHQPTRRQLGSSTLAVALGTWPMAGVTSIDNDDAEYILLTFKGIHEKTSLLENNRCRAEHILANYDKLLESR